MTNTKIPVRRDDDDELLGFITKDRTSWSAQTIFGYIIGRVETKKEATDLVYREGLASLKGMWRYQDSDHEWYPCILKEVYENRVVVIRTNELGFQDSEHYKLVILKNPTEEVLLKA